MRKEEPVSTLDFQSLTIKNPGNDSTSLLLTLAALGFSIILGLMFYCMNFSRGTIQDCTVKYNNCRENNSTGKNDSCIFIVCFLSCMPPF